jgi:hypothetical protein
MLKAMAIGEGEVGQVEFFCGGKNKTASLITSGAMNYQPSGPPHHSDFNHAPLTRLIDLCSSQILPMALIECVTRLSSTTVTQSGPRRPFTLG